uniref:protein-serine/threonine phosphatase n=1 Tax=Zea mays TaxID=4577 RepID=A0A804MYI4_MAIZE
MVPTTMDAGGDGERRATVAAVGGGGGGALKLRRIHRLDVVQSGYTAVHIQTRDLIVVANAGDSRVVLGTASDDGAVTPSSSSST